MKRARVRKSQLLAPFGIGAMLDLPEESLMLLGQEHWVTGSVTNLIKDARLGKRLGVSHFREPTSTSDDETLSAEERVMQFTRFPRWYFCQRCRQMKQAPIASTSVPECDGLYKPCSTNKQRAIEARRRRLGLPKMVPVRFVIACPNGHLDDFPWVAWAHRKGEVCASPMLRLNQGQNPGLVGLKALCTNGACQGIGENLGVAAGRGAFRQIGCSGHRPWLGRYEDVRETCTEEPKMIQRGASNAYFARIVTSILIPPFSNKLFKILEGPFFQELLDRVGTLDGAIDDKAVFPQTALFYQVDETELRNAYYAKLSNDQNTEKFFDEDNEESYRFAEYRAFKGAYLGESQDDLRLKNSDLSLCSNHFRKFFDTVVLIDKLVETRCLRGFSRLDPGNPRAPLAKTRQEWLPAIAGTGEGIFLELNHQKLEAWGKTPSVLRRVEQMEQRAASYRLARRRSGDAVIPLFVMLHTLAHALTRRLSFDCGYGSSSIRERIYASTQYSMAGLLLYTSEAGSEGTLGGLVGMGEPQLLEGTFFDALNDTAFCSNDPLCEESSGQGPGSINLAACQGCCLIPETSCEESNFFLDRALLVGSATNPELGFFSDLLIDLD